jgi:hypothetical protein
MLFSWQSPPLQGRNHTTSNLKRPPSSKAIRSRPFITSTTGQFISQDRNEILKIYTIFERRRKVMIVVMLHVVHPSLE